MLELASYLHLHNVDCTQCCALYISIHRLYFPLMWLYTAVHIPFVIRYVISVAAIHTHVVISKLTKVFFFLWRFGVEYITQGFEFKAKLILWKLKIVN